MDENFIYLMTADNEIEAKIMESKLIFYGLEVRLEYSGAWAFMNIAWGSAVGPVDIYVHKDHAEEALELLETE